LALQRFINFEVVYTISAALIIKIACTFCPIFYLILKLGLQFQLSIRRSGVFWCFIKSTSIVHRFRYDQLFFVARIHVMAFSPLGGTAGDMCMYEF